jgi:hypothetical protein
LLYKQYNKKKKVEEEVEEEKVEEDECSKQISLSSTEIIPNDR